MVAEDEEIDDDEGMAKAPGGRDWREGMTEGGALGIKTGVAVEEEAENDKADGVSEARCCRVSAFDSVC